MDGAWDELDSAVGTGQGRAASLIDKVDVDVEALAGIFLISPAATFPSLIHIM